MATLTPRMDKIDAGQNLIINGAMDFWQRGTTFATVGSVYTADRWQHLKVGSMSGTLSRDTDVPTAAQSGFQSAFSLKYTVTTAQPSIGANDYHLLGYAMEGYDYQNIASGKPFRLQFWVKSSVTGTYSASLRNSNATRYYMSTFTINSANTWEKKVFDITSDSSGTWLLDNSIGFKLYITLACGSTYQTSTLNSWQSGNVLGAAGQTNFNATNSSTFLLSQVALYEGSFSPSADLPFKRAGKTIGDELRMCQRYCYTIVPLNSSGLLCQGAATTTSSCTSLLMHPVTMRATPVLTAAGVASDYRLDGVATSTVTTLPVGINGSPSNIGVVAAVAATLTAGQGYTTIANTGIAAKFTIEAEL